tara:strand:+ start:256 stop:573 length:318 start_codon:yes stop_codon:yes gene_type:complete
MKISVFKLRQIIKEEIKLCLQESTTAIPGSLGIPLQTDTETAKPEKETDNYEQAQDINDEITSLHNQMGDHPTNTQNAQLRMLQRKRQNLADIVDESSLKEFYDG